MRYCQYLERLESRHMPVYGEEIKRLIQISKTGVPVTPAFVVAPEVFEHFFQSPAIKAEILTHCRDLRVKNAPQISQAAFSVRELIHQHIFPAPVAKSLQTFFREFREHLLHSQTKKIRISISGINTPFEVSAVIHEEEEFLDLLKELFSLCFEDIQLFERILHKDLIIPQAFPLLVQYSEPAQFSGLAYNYDPELKDENTIAIEAAHLESGADNLATHDLYRVDKKSLTLLSRSLSKHWWAEAGEGKFVSSKELESVEGTIGDTKAVSLARTIRNASKDIDEALVYHWRYAHRQFWIHGVEPYCWDEEEISYLSPAPLLEGSCGCLGQVSGPARLIRSRKDFSKLKKGDIAVLEQVSTRDAEELVMAAGLITEIGWSHSVEAEISRQVGIPAVVGTGVALSHLQDGQMVTVDAVRGVVLAGKHQLEYATCNSVEVPVLATKVYAAIHEPHAVKPELLRQVDGIGLLRGEFILRLIGAHPRDILHRQLGAEYAEILKEGLEDIFTLIAPRPVIYQLHDLASADLLGFRERHHDRHEPNPALGYRGSHRLLQELDILDLELAALTRLAERGMDSFSEMMPMVRSVEEVEQMLAYLRRSPLATKKEIKLWVKCETPAMLILIEELCRLPIAGICFDVPSLAQFITGFDKANMQVGHLSNQADESVLQALSFAISTCRAAGLPCMILSEEDMLLPEVVQMAVQSGVTAIVSDLNFIPELRPMLAAIERHENKAHLSGKKRKE